MKDIKTSTPPVAALVKGQRISWTLTQRHRLMPWSEYLCPTQNWYVENLMFGVMLLVGITLMNGISTWQRGSRRISNTWQSGSRKISSPSCHEDTVRRYRLRTTKRTLTRRFTGHPDRGLPAFRTVTYTCVLFVSHLVCGIGLAKPFIQVFL